MKYYICKDDIKVYRFRGSAWMTKLSVERTRLLLQSQRGDYFVTNHNIGKKKCNSVPCLTACVWEVKVPTEKVFSVFSVFRSFSVFGEKLQPKKTEKSKRKMSKIEYFFNLFMSNLPKKCPKIFQILSSITKWPSKWHLTGKLKLIEVSCSFLKQFFEK